MEDDEFEIQCEDALKQTVFLEPNADVTIPTSTTLRLLNENFGPEFTFDKEVGRLMIKMGTEFVVMLSSAGYDFAEKDGMSTITPRHIISALLDLGYGDYVDEIKTLIEETKANDKKKKDKKLKRANPAGGISMEELLKQQTELFGAARAKMESQNQGHWDEDGGDGGGSGSGSGSGF